MDIKEWNNDLDALPGKIEKINFTVRHYYKNGKKVATFLPDGTAELFGEFQDQDLDEAKIIAMKIVGEELFDEESYNDARQAAVTERKNFWKDFKQAVFTEVGVVDHPKAEKLWEIVFENRRGEGLRALLEEAEELSELMKD